MAFRLTELEWNNDTALFPGDRSTVTTDELCPWRCLSEIIPGLFLTCEEELLNRNLSLDKGIALIINLCGADYVAPYKVYECAGDSQIPAYRRIDGFDEFVRELDEYTKCVGPLVTKNRKVFLHTIAAIDAPTYEIDRHFPSACALIELVLSNRAKYMEKEHNVARVPSVGVHCMVGVSRSASVVVAYLMKRTGVCRDEAISFAQRTRPVVNPNPGFQQQLILWEATRCQRIFDELSADLVSSEVKQKKDVLEYIRTQLPLILKHGKCIGERAYFGYVIAHALNSDEDQMINVYRELRSYITAAVDNEVYVDTPNFFGYAAEVFNSIVRYIPEMLLKVSADFESHGLAWSDALYYRLVKDVGRSGFVKDTCDTVRAFCSLLEAINIKQLASCPLSLISKAGGCVTRLSSVPAYLSLSFPFLPFMAPYAEGFVDFSELGALESEFPLQGEPFSSEATAEVIERVSALFLSSFLVSASGVSNAPPQQSDSEEGTCATRFSRWSETSRVLYLKSDVEVRVFEQLTCLKTQEEIDTMDLSVFHEAGEDELVAMAVSRKIAAGALAFRLLLETVDHFVQEAYSERLGGRIMSHSNEAFPLSFVKSIMQRVDLPNEGKSGHPVNLVSYFKTELEPLVQCEVVHPGGVWSLLQFTGEAVG